MKFRKKPVVIEAFQMTKERRVDNSEWPNWLNRAWQLERGTEGSVYPVVPNTGDGLLGVGTLEAQQLISWNDWIIQGIKGELYPCKPDIFEATYEPEESNSAIAARDKWWAEGTQPIIDSFIELIQHGNYSNGNEAQGADEGEYLAANHLKDLIGRWQSLKKTLGVTNGK